MHMVSTSVQLPPNLALNLPYQVLFSATQQSIVRTSVAGGSHKGLKQLLITEGVRGGKG